MKTREDHIKAAREIEYVPAKDHGQRKKMRGYDNINSHMHGWPTQRRMDSWAYPLIEIFCKHGVGHPMPESVEWCELQKPGGRWSRHGCDGCCIRPYTTAENKTSESA